MADYRVVINEVQKGVRACPTCQRTEAGHDWPNCMNFPPTAPAESGEVDRLREQFELLDDPDGLYTETKTRIEAMARAKAIAECVEKINSMRGAEYNSEFGTMTGVVEGGYIDKVAAVELLQSLAKGEGEDGDNARKKLQHLVATCNDVYIVYDYDERRRRRIRGLKAMRGDGIIPLRHPQEFADTLLKVIADCDRYNASLAPLTARKEKEGESDVTE